MKEHVGLAMLVGMAALLGTPVLGRIMGGPEHEAKVVFDKEKLAEGTRWSPDCVLTDAGLVLPKGERDIWIQTQKIPVGFSWRPPHWAGITLSIHGVARGPLHLRAYVRYGCDGVHWSSWYYMREGQQCWGPLADEAGSWSGKLVEGALQTYGCDLRVPDVARAPYEELMMEWSETERYYWKGDEDALCRWIVSKDPGFFGRNLPFIGYVMFRLEGYSLEPEAKIESLSVRPSWVVGGLGALPPGEREFPRDQWKFDMR